MAVKREVLKDINEYKTAVVAGLTRRQLVSSVVGGGIGASIYFALNPYFIKDFTIIMAAIPTTIILAIGFIPAFGMPLEKFMFIWAKNFILTPYYRKYKSTNVYEEMLTDKPLILTKKQIKKNAKELKARNITVYK